MTTFNLHNVLIASSAHDKGWAVEQIVSKAPQYRVSTMKVEELGTGKTDVPPEIVIFDVTDIGTAEVDTLNQMRDRFPDVPVIVTSEPLDQEAVHRLLKLRVHDWLVKPVTKEKILGVLQSAIRTAKATNNRVHAVVSTVGGAGATTVAVSMADLLATKIFKKKANVALFDLDFSTGNCSYLLNMVSSYNIESLAANPSRIDVELTNLIQQKHEHGFYVYSFKRPDINTELNGFEMVLRMLDAVTLQHEHTVLDIPYYEIDWKDEVLSGVNTCTLVTELNLPALKHCLDALRRVREIRGENYPVSVLINKESRHLFGGRISKAKLKELFGDTPFYFIPEDRGTVADSVDRGVLPSDVSSGSKFLKALTTYIKTLDLGGNT